MYLDPTRTPGRVRKVHASARSAARRASVGHTVATRGAALGSRQEPATRVNATVGGKPGKVAVDVKLDSTATANKVHHSV